ncbi:MAG TPA: hypothetical protein VKH37_11825, partial [Ferruginibacter sp.]|nr:hypothetical protein [Ferruginibacter sp.]
MTKDEILLESLSSFAEFGDACGSFDEPKFFDRPGEKWSVAENMQHLVLSIGTTTLAYSLPKFVVKMVGGKPKRKSMTYDELLARYNKKIEEGGKASARYVPKPIAIKYGKDRLLQNWNSTTSKFLKALELKRNEPDLDNYQAKHPLLGPITLRELCY